MMGTIKNIILIILIGIFSACIPIQGTIAPVSESQIPATAFTVQSTSTPDVKGTETMAAQLTPIPSVTPSLLDQLSAGMYIVYEGNEGSGFDSIPSIHVLSLDGQKLGMLATTIPDKATISPDGQKIAYINFTSPGRSNLTIFDLKTYQYKSLYVSECFMAYYTTAWSPDNSQIAVSCGNFIAIVDITAVKGEVAKIIQLLKLADEKDSEIQDPTWSPDGRYLSFYIANLNDARDSSPHGPYLANPECPENITECQITPQKLEVTGLSISKWTPDNLLAVVQENRIRLFDPTTKKLTKSISIPVDTPILSFAWSPDNQWIAYSVGGQSTNVLTKEIYIIPPFGGKPALLSDNVDDVIFWLQILK